MNWFCPVQSHPHDPVASPRSVGVDPRHARHVRRRVVALPVALAAAAQHQLLAVPFGKRLDPLQVADRPKRAPLPVARLLLLVRLRSHAVAVARLGDVLEELLHVFRTAPELVAVGVDQHRDAVVRAAPGVDGHPVRRRRLDGTREVAGHGPRAGAGDAHRVEAHLLVGALHGRHLRVHRHCVKFLHACGPKGVVVRRLVRHRDQLRLHAGAALEEHALLPTMVLGHALAVLRHHVRLDADKSRLVALRLQHKALRRERQRRAPALLQSVVAPALPVDEVGVRRQRLLHPLQLQREHHFLARLVEHLAARRGAHDQGIVPVQSMRGRPQQGKCRKTCLLHRQWLSL